jgi:hypothetical protein
MAKLSVSHTVFKLSSTHNNRCVCWTSRLSVNLSQIRILCNVWFPFLSYSLLSSSLLSLSLVRHHASACRLSPEVCSFEFSVAIVLSEHTSLTWCLPLLFVFYFSFATLSHKTPLVPFFPFQLAILSIREVLPYYSFNIIAHFLK